MQGFLPSLDAEASHRRRRSRGFVAAVAVLPLLAVFAAGTPLTGAQASSSTTVAPTYVRTIGTANGGSTMYPSGVAVDAAGNVYVADTGNYKIEKYQVGTTTLLWSVGVRGATIGGGTDSFVAPRDVATDGTFVYVGDTDNAIVQVLKASDGSFVKQIKTFGSGGTQKLQDPIGISVGHNASNTEEILVSDGVSGNVYVFDTSFTLQFTVPPTAKTEGTRDAATDSLGNIYTADYRGNKVDKYSPTGTFISSWGGTTPACKNVAKPYGIDIDASNHVYVASSNLEQIMVFDTNGNCLNVGTTSSNAIGTKVTSPSSTGLFQLRRVAVGAGSSPLVYAADLWGLKILTYKSSDGTIASTAQPMLGSNAYPPFGGLNEDHGVAVDPSTGQVFATNTVNQRIERFNLDGSAPFDWGTKGVVESSASFNWAQGIAYDPKNGNIWVANTRNNRIDEFKTDGTPITSCPNTARLTSSFNWPMAVAFNPAGIMYVADTFNNKVEAIDPATCTGSTVTPIWSVGTRGTGTNQFIKPWNLVYDPTLNRVLVTDTNNSRIVSLNATTGAWNPVLPIAKGAAAGQILLPEGIAVDAAGDVWVADTGNNRVEEFTSTGTFTNQMIGSYGCCFNALNNQFNAPQGLAFDSAGLLYVADANNNRIQVYTPSATSSVFHTPSVMSTTPVFQRDIFNAGGIAPMYPAGGGTDSSGTMWVADSGGSRVDKITSGGVLSYVTPTTGAQLSNPRNLSLDVTTPSDLWITDTGNNGIVEMNTSGTVLLRLTSLSLKSPFGNANDANNIYVADTYNHRVIAVSKTSHAIVWSTATTCPAPGGKGLLRIRDVAVGSDGKIYAVDTDNNRVVEFDPSSGGCIGSGWTGVSGHTLHQPRALTSDGSGGLWIAEDGGKPALVHYNNAGTTFIGSTTNGGGGFVEPEGVFLDGANVVVADPFAFRTVSFTVSQANGNLAGTAFFKGGPALGGFNNPFGVAYAPNGDCFVSDMFNQRIEKFTACTGTPIATGHFGGGVGNMQNPRGISVSSDGLTVILTNSENERIDLFSASTLAYQSSITPTCGKMYFPHQAAFDSANNSYWIADTNNKRILDVSSTGTCLANWTAGGVLKAPRGIAWDGTSVWVADAQLGEVFKCTTTGTCTAVAKKSGTPTTVMSPWNLTIANSDLYIADANAAKIVVMTLASPYSTVFSFGTLGTNPGLGQFESPRSVSVSSTGQIAVADFTNNDISLWK